MILQRNATKHNANRSKYQENQTSLTKRRDIPSTISILKPCQDRQSPRSKLSNSAHMLFSCSLLSLAPRLSTHSSSLYHTMRLPLPSPTSRAPHSLLLSLRLSCPTYTLLIRRRRRPRRRNPPLLLLLLIPLFRKLLAPRPGPASFLPRTRTRAWTPTRDRQRS